MKTRLQFSRDPSAVTNCAKYDNEGRFKKLYRNFDIIFEITFIVQKDYPAALASLLTT